MYNNMLKKDKSTSLIKYIGQTLVTVVPLSLAVGTLASMFVIKLNGAQLIKAIACFLIAGLLLGVFASFKNYKKFIKPLNEINKMAAYLKDSNITYSMDRNKAGGQSDIIDSLNESVSNLRINVKLAMEVGKQVSEAPIEMKKSIEILSSISRQVSEAIAELAKGAVLQAQSAEEMSSSVTGIAEGINNIAVDIDETEELTKNALDTVKSGEKSVQHQEVKMNESKEFILKVSEAISALAEKSKEIGEILVVINGIAEQTNLLSLNAAIEAARAGEQGKGFAVVANEVGKLAEQSGSSVQKIEGLIREVRSDIEKAVAQMKNVEGVAIDQEKAMTETKKSFAGVAEAVATISENIKLVNAASDTITQNSKKAESAIEYIVGVSEEAASSTQQVAASTDDQAETVQRILESAEKLSEMSEKLKNSIGHFTV